MKSNDTAADSHQEFDGHIDKSIIQEDVEQLKQRLNNIEYRLRTPNFINSAYKDLLKITYSCNEEIAEIFINSQAFSRFIENISSDCPVLAFKVLVNLTKYNSPIFALLKLNIFNLIYQAIKCNDPEYIELALKVLNNIIMSSKVAKVAAICTGVVTVAGQFYQQSPLVRLLSYMSSLMLRLFKYFKNESENHDNFNDDFIQQIFHEIPDVEYETAIYIYANGLDEFYIPSFLPTFALFVTSEVNDAFLPALRIINYFTLNVDYARATVQQTNLIQNVKNILQREDDRITSNLFNYLTNILYTLDYDVFQAYLDNGIFDICKMYIESNADPSIKKQCFTLLSNMLHLNTELIPLIFENNFILNALESVNSSVSTSDNAIWLIANIANERPDLTKDFYTNKIFIDACNKNMENEPNNATSVILTSFITFINKFGIQDKSLLDEFLSLVDVSQIEALAGIAGEIGENAEQFLQLIDY